MLHEEVSVEVMVAYHTEEVLADCLWRWEGGGGVSLLCKYYFLEYFIHIFNANKFTLVMVSSICLDFTKGVISFVF